MRNFDYVFETHVASKSFSKNDNGFYVKRLSVVKLSINR